MGAPVGEDDVIEVTTNTDIFNLLYYGFLFAAAAMGMSKGGQR